MNFWPWPTEMHNIQWPWLMVSKTVGTTKFEKKNYPTIQEIHTALHFLNHTPEMQKGFTSSAYRGHRQFPEG